MTKVLCLKNRNNLKEGINTYTLSNNWDDYTWLPRSQVDDKTNVEEAMLTPQVIPYIAVIQNNLILNYSRKTGNETRLHGNRSIGFGGHIDKEDEKDTPHETILSAATRELKEELGIIVEAKNISNTLIVDFTNDVGKVHIGMAIIIGLPKEYQINLDNTDEEISDLQFTSLEEVTKNYEQYENWSKYLLADIW